MSTEKIYKIQVKALGKWHTKEVIVDTNTDRAVRMMLDCLNDENEIAQFGRVIKMTGFTSYCEEFASDKDGNYIGIEC